MDYMRPKSPSELSKPERLRGQAKELKSKADRFLKEADALNAEAERLEQNAAKTKSRPKEDFNQAAFRALRETNKRSEE
jgi:hypothetical protein